MRGCNTPIQPVYDAGCRTIIAVLLDMDTLVDISALPDAQVLFVYPQKSNGQTMSGCLDFDGNHADRRMDQGYADAVRILEPIYRMGTAQLRYAATLEVARAQQAEFKNLQQELEAARENSETAKAHAKAAIEDLSLTR